LSASLLIFYLDDLSFEESRVLKSPTIIVFQSLSLVLLIFVLYILVPQYCVHTYLKLFPLSESTPLLLFNHFPYLTLLLFTYSLLDISMATRGFFCIPLAWNILLHPFIFSLGMSLDMKRVSYKQHIVGTCFLFIYWLCVF
jgi:hypothetical protein